MTNLTAETFKEKIFDYGDGGEVEWKYVGEKPAIIDFYADWCIECKHLERQTFRHASVQAALRDVVLLRADVTANDAADRELLQRFQLFGPPAVLFFDSDGTEMRDIRLLGFVGPADFATHLAELQ